MKKKSLKLKELEVKSFITTIDGIETPTIGGASISARILSFFTRLTKKADDVVVPAPKPATPKKPFLEKLDPDFDAKIHSDFPYVCDSAAALTCPVVGR